MNKPGKQYWLLKSEPSTYSWDDLMATGHTWWDGVRNHQAKRNLMAMQVGDEALFYHSVHGKCVVGRCLISDPHQPDTTAEAGQSWVAVGVKPVTAFKTPVTLEQIKTHPDLKEIALVRQSRLSVVPLSQKEFKTIEALSQ